MPRQRRRPEAAVVERLVWRVAHERPYLIAALLRRAVRHVTTVQEIKITEDELRLLAEMDTEGVLQPFRRASDPISQLYQRLVQDPTPLPDAEEVQRATARRVGIADLPEVTIESQPLVELPARIHITHPLGLELEGTGCAVIQATLAGDGRGEIRGSMRVHGPVGEGLESDELFGEVEVYVLHGGTGQPEAHKVKVYYIHRPLGGAPVLHFHEGEP